MAGQSSNLKVSSSRCSRSMEEIERQLVAAKRQRSSQLNAMVAHPNGGAAVPVVPFHYAAGGGHAMTVAFPMAGVNGAALRWSTAATLGAADQAAAALPMPPIAGVNGPSAAPFVVGPMLIGSPAPAVGLPLAVALDRIKDNALRVMLSALMLSCNPPVGQRQGWTGAPPPWWPTAAEDWWDREVVAHLNTMRVHTPVPFAPAYKLKKVQKVAVLVAIVKHLSPDFDRIFKKVVEVSQNGRAKLTAEEKDLWKSALENEAARHKSGSVPVVPMFNFVLQQQAPPPHGDGHRLAPIGAATTENVVRGGGVAVAVGDGREQQVVNLAGASVTAPAGNGSQAVAAADPEQHGDGALHGGAMAADGGGERPVDIPGDDGALFLSHDVHQVAADPAEQQGLIDISDAAAADMDQLLNDMLAPYQTQQVAVEKAPEARPWYMEEDMSSFFDDFDEVPGVTPYYY